MADRNDDAEKVRQMMPAFYGPFAAFSRCVQSDYFLPLQPEHLFRPALSCPRITDQAFLLDDLIHSKLFVGS